MCFPLTHKPFNSRSQILCKSMTSQSMCLGELLTTQVVTGAWFVPVAQSTSGRDAICHLSTGYPYDQTPVFNYFGV